MLTSPRWLHRMKASTELKVAVVVTSLVLLVMSGLVITNRLYFADRAYPNLSIAGQQVGMLTRNELRTLLTEETAKLRNQGWKLTLEDKTFELPFAETNSQLAVDDLTERVMAYGRDGSTLDNWLARGRLLIQPVEVASGIAFTPGDSFAAFLDGLKSQVDNPAVNAQLSFESDAATIVPSREGQRLDTAELNEQLQARLAQLSDAPITLQLRAEQPSIRAEDIEPLLEQVGSWVDSPYRLTHEEATLEVSPEQLRQWLTTEQDESGAVRLTWNSETARQALWQWGEANLHRAAQDAVFEMANGRVSTFVPSQQGRTIDLNETLNAMAANTREGQHEVSLALSVVDPEVSTGEANELGIQELVATGVSYFTGSSWARIENIKTATDKLNGTIVKPGQVFSFNQTVGDITADAGFVEGLIISGNATVPGVGGGVCQTSTTMFRAILNGGYPVVERNPHSYRVRYYEIGGPGYEFASPGIDAAIYSPSLDLKFENDTPYAILILTHFDRANSRLTYEFYSTDSGRQVTISQPHVYNQRAAPPPVYFDMPDMPEGYLKQVDWAVAGAETDFTRTITYPDGEVKEESFYSRYRPWSAKYERGTAGAEDQESPSEEQSV